MTASSWFDEITPPGIALENISLPERQRAVTTGAPPETPEPIAMEEMGRFIERPWVWIHLDSPSAIGRFSADAVHATDRQGRVIYLRAVWWQLCAVSAWFGTVSVIVAFEALAILMSWLSGQGPSFRDGALLVGLTAFIGGVLPGLVVYYTQWQPARRQLLRKLDEGRRVWLNYVRTCRRTLHIEGSPAFVDAVDMTLDTAHDLDPLLYANAVQRIRRIYQVDMFPRALLSVRGLGDEAACTHPCRTVAPRDATGRPGRARNLYQVAVTADPGLHGRFQEALLREIVRVQVAPPLEGVRDHDDDQDAVDMRTRKLLRQVAKDVGQHAVEPHVSG